VNSFKVLFKTNPKHKYMMYLLTVWCSQQKTIEVC